MARRLGVPHMRVLGAVGGVVACAGAGVAVAVSPKPAGAPLNPPVDASVAVDHAPASPSASACPTNSPGMATTGAPVDPSLQAVVQQLRGATTAAQRRAILQGLSADQRQQVTALLRSRAGQRGGAGGAATCDAPAQPLPSIQPDVVDGGAPAAPVTNSYVS